MKTKSSQGEENQPSINASAESPRPAQVQSNDEEPLVHTVEFQVCDACVRMKGEECHTPGCVFCFRSVSDAIRVLNDTLICPIVNGERLILIERAPINMLLFCPQCAEQHIDDPQLEKGWDNPPHRSHECQFCGYVWRPADVATNGVAQITTEGKRDGRARPRYFKTAKDFEDALAYTTNQRTSEHTGSSPKR